MIIRNGITSFFRHRQCPAFLFADFQQIVMATTAPMGLRVLELVERGITPNFHIARVERAGDETWILGHCNYPIIAFADPFSPMPLHIPFRDADAIASRIVASFPHVTIATQHELSRTITAADLEQLNRIEREQVKYWKPTTIGQLAFNYWD